jgi:diguanylate cyclase (GGDEF)-like protein
MNRTGSENRWSISKTATSGEIQASGREADAGYRRGPEELEPRPHGFQRAPGEPAEVSPLRSWPFLSTFGSKTWIGEHDVLLGFGLIAAYCVVALVGMLLFPVGSVSAGPVVATVGATLAIDSALLGLFGRRIKGPMLLCFPLLLIGSELAISLLVPGGEATEFTGFFTLMFVFIGLTQRRGVGPLFALVAGASWAVIQRPWTAQVGVKLVLALAIWVLISEILAVRQERVRIHTGRLVTQVNTDVLTGLGSRLLLSDRIERTVAENEGCASALLFIDLDGFKRINDTYGHSSGDELLIAVARRVKGVLRSGDVAARLGGDQFVVFLASCNLDQAVDLAQDLLASLSEPFGLSMGRVATTASIGIVKVERPDSAELVLRRADRAMGEAKSAGRNGFSIYETSMEEQTIRRIELETQLRDGPCRPRRHHWGRSVDPVATPRTWPSHSRRVPGRLGGYWSHGIAR